MEIAASAVVNGPLARVPTAIGGPVAIRYENVAIGRDCNASWPIEGICTVSGYSPSLPNIINIFPVGLNLRTSWPMIAPFKFLADIPSTSAFLFTSLAHKFPSCRTDQIPKSAD